MSRSRWTNLTFSFFVCHSNQLSPTKTLTYGNFSAKHRYFKSYGTSLECCRKLRAKKDLLNQNLNFSYIYPCRPLIESILGLLGWRRQNQSDIVFSVPYLLFYPLNLNLHVKEVINLDECCFILGNNLDRQVVEEPGITTHITLWLISF